MGQTTGGHPAGLQPLSVTCSAGTRSGQGGGQRGRHGAVEKPAWEVPAHQDPEPPAACHTHACRDVRVARVCSRTPRRVPCSVSARSEQLGHTSGREKTCVFPSSMCLEGKPALWPFLGEFDER